MFSGYLMSKDKKLAVIEKGQITEVLNEELMPLLLKKNSFIDSWLASRAVDSHRVNSRLLKKALNLTQKDDISTVLSVNGVTITDTYWVKEKSSLLTYEDVKFKKNDFVNLALYGDLSCFNQPASRSPELTNTGSFEKGWKTQNGDWWLYKSANTLELFTEIFISKMAKNIGVYTVEYFAEEGYIKCKDFTNNASVNFEPAYNFVLDNEDYAFCYDAFLKLDPKGTLAKEYVKLIFLDTLCGNFDRHTFNFGVLRDTETGEIISLAPNFDNNIALIYRGYTLDETREKDALIRLFVSFLKDKNVKFEVPFVDEKMIKRAIDEIGIEVDNDYIINFVINGYNKIKAGI